MTKPIFSLLVTTAVMLAAPAFAADKWTHLNLTLADEHITPRYTLLAERSERLAQELGTLCSRPDAARLAAAQRHFHATMDAWQGIAHIRFGPVEMFLRHHRMQLWPDKHGTGAKQLRRLLLEKDPQTLHADNFRHLSVAVQGLGALERLLFGNGAQAEAFRAGEQASYRCRLAEAIGHNIAGISHELAGEWRTRYRETLLGAEQGNDEFDSSKEVSAKLLNNLFTALQVVVDQKLLRPMGDSAELAKPRRAESWRSRRSLQNIAANLAAAEEMYRIGFAPLLSDAPQQHRAISRAFAEALRLARAAKQPLYESVADPQRRSEAEALLQASSTLKRLIGTELPRAIGLPLGFNALDGD